MINQYKEIIGMASRDDLVHSKNYAYSEAMIHITKLETSIEILRYLNEIY